MQTLALAPSAGVILQSERIETMAFCDLFLDLCLSSEFERCTTQIPSTIAAATLATLTPAAGITQRRGSGTTFGRSARADSRIRRSRVSGTGGRSTS